MTKSEFILSLSEALAHLPGQERSRVLEYYEEMIDDRIESGMTEEDAVAALGSIEEILKEAAPEALNAARSHSEEATPERGGKCILLREPIDTLIANSACAELHILSQKLPDGVTARVDYNLSENEECLCSLEGGRLEVRYKSIKQRGFSLRNLFTSFNASIAITLNDPALARGEISASSGSIDLTELVFTDSLDVGTASGDLDAHDIAVRNNCKLHAASGDITGHNLTCGEVLEISTASGDIEVNSSKAGRFIVGTASGDSKLGSIECDALEAHSASGDAELHRIKSGSISLGSASGDITLADSECSGTIEAGSTSGDVELRDVSCAGSMDLSSTSGDVKGRLSPAENYSFRATSRIGDVKVPHTNGNCPVDIRTMSGDITFSSH